MPTILEKRAAATVKSLMNRRAHALKRVEKVRAAAEEKLMPYHAEIEATEMVLQQMGVDYLAHDLQNPDMVEWQQPNDPEIPAVEGSAANAE